MEICQWINAFRSKAMGYWEKWDGLFVGLALQEGIYEFYRD